MRNFRGDGPVRSWLLAIARHVCADHVRRRVRERSLVDRLAARTLETSTPGPEARSDLLDVLDRDRREAFVLTQLLDLSYEDAAAILGCPVGTIRSRVFRARADLQAAAQQRLAAEA